jgi:hypothetical protein
MLLDKSKKRRARLKPAEVGNATLTSVEGVHGVEAGGRSAVLRGEAPGLLAIEVMLRLAQHHHRVGSAPAKNRTGAGG